MNETAQPYVPGVCNINHAEIAYRRKAGHIGLALSVVIAAALLLIDLPVWLRVIVFIPAFIAAIGYLQARNKFCVAYGAAGQQNASEGSKSAAEVADEAAKATDRKKARRMNLQAAGIALLVTVILIVIPR